MWGRGCSSIVSVDCSYSCRLYKDRSMQATVLLLLLVCCMHVTEGQVQQVQFVQTPYFPTVQEEQPINSTVVTVGAAILDSFGTPQRGTFTIPVTGDAQYFNVENTGLDAGVNSAVVRNSIVFDWDAENAQRQYTFPITFVSGSGASSTAQVSVSIEDINDNAPEFVRNIFEVGVFEGLPGGTSVFNVTATDPDQVLLQQVIVDRGNNVFDTQFIYTVQNGRITYNITSGNGLNHFMINSENGTLSIAPGVQLDVNQIQFYNFTVMATDGGGLSDIALVLVTILDANNNPPRILNPRGVDLTLPEDTAPGYVIVEGINATDLDSGANSLVTFLIVDGVLRESFSIDEVTGKITVSGPLDREVQSVLNLTVVARDQGVPMPLQDTIFVVIRLLDINDYTPRFTQGSFEVSISEGSGIGSSVARLLAVDLDEGINGTVSYSIVQGGEGKFYVDSSTGEIFTNATLDREQVPSYDLVVRAVDNPSNDSYQLSSEVNVTILVEDVNDNTPIFSQNVYEISILDNVTRREPIIQLTATDIDSGPNGMVMYRIEVSDPTYPEAFRIDENTGIVFRNRRLSFENQSRFTYTIRALDNGPFRRSRDVPLIIILHNVNENPPVFDELSYNTTVIETTPLGHVILNVSATDPDVGPIGEVRYRIVTEFDEAGSFGVNETTGDIIVTSSLDFDFRDVIFFVVEAYDGGFPEPFTDCVNVTVCLTGANDEPPSIIFPAGFQLFVPENTPPEVDVVTLRDFTFDPDPGLGGEFFFSLVEIYDPFSINDSFSLNETTGLIRSLRVFDRELQPQGIIIAVQTIDLLNISQVTNLTIMIRDMNDNAPYFELNISTSVYEFLPPGTPVLAEYRAEDDDIGSNADLRYALYNGAGREMFAIDAITSALRTAAILNKTVQDTYNLTVIVMDLGTPQLFGFGAIYVKVVDSNDMVPIFSQSLYNASFSESDPIGTFLLQVNATDSDIGTNSQLEYFLAPNSSDSERFTLNATTGELFTNDMFDRENISFVELTVTAVDSGLVPQPLTGTATVLVSIRDYNEFPPVFNESFYEAMVTENTANGTFVAAVFASDKDAEPPNNLTEYSLEGNRSSVFAIDPMRGVVTVSGEVDWEQGAEFNITVIASDLATVNPLNGSVNLMITILDVNDQAPVFVPNSLNLSIEENLPAGDGVVVGYVRSTDADSPGNNSDVTYSVLMDFTNRKFLLDAESGLVRFVRGTLNRERRASYDSLIRATDHGLPTPLHTDAILTVTVLDANDFNPVFDPNRYSVSVPEMAPIGTPVLTLRATDADSGTNANLIYSIADPINMNVFEVNETSGVISVAGVLDFETIRVYSFRVIVADQGLPSRNDSAQVEITVTDSNDHTPLFNQSEYSAVIRENLASGTTLLRVFAEDADTDPENTVITYSLGISEGSENFGIDPETGVVYTNAYLNREDFSSYNLTITANNSLSPYPLLSQVQLLVAVTDLNDMHPTFELVIDVFVFENMTIGSIVHTLRAEDGDEGVNGTIEYTLVQLSEFFSLNGTSGELSLLQVLDYEGSQRLYILPIMASDLGNQSLSNYTNVLIYVLDANDQPPRFASPDYSVTIDSESGLQTSVVMLDVSDADEGPNAAITLSFLSGNDLNLFEIGGDGVIATAASLRPHAGQQFVLTVEASDSVFRDLANVSVYVQGGVATMLPFFDSRSYRASLSEVAQDGEVVMEFGPVTENEVSYSVNSEAFSISSTGTLSVENSSLLDFESSPLHQLTVGIQNSMGDDAYAILNVELIDENEHAPIFISDSFFVGIPETLALSMPFFTAIAYDEDGAMPANVITYDISQTDPLTRSLFRINSQTGSLSLTRSLGYESGDTGFNITVTATNSQATPQFPTTARIEILVLNGNSFNPVFAQNLYTLRLPEDFATGISVLNVSAEDGDLGSHGEVTFGIHGDHRYLDFRIDTFTGELFTNAGLDYERKTFYTLEIVASDGGNPGRSTIVPIEVFIEDLNDNTPIWQQEIYSVNIIENATVGSSVILVSASDVDQVDSALVNGVLVFYNRNGYVTFTITNGDPIGNFNIDPDTGLVSVASSLDREVYPEYNLTLNATDGGGLFANAYLNVIVHDINDKIPYFLENPYVVGLSEDADVGTLVLIVQANDTDLNRNSEILYHFADSSLDFYDPSGIFFLNDTTGEVRLEAAIDREDVPHYNLTVIAVDMGDVQLTGTTQVLVNLLDINEFPPEFTQLGFSGEVFENEPPGTTILQVNSTDLDFGENSTVYYSIISGDTSVFAIAAETGIISVAGFLDFEVIRKYELIIMATDTGPITERLVNTTNVSIAVLDRNDNSPVFSEPFYIASIPEDSVPGDMVLNVNVSDADSGSNAELLFALDFLSNGEARRNFIIDSITGAITLSNISNLDTERTSSYDIVINVADRGTPSLMNDVSVTIMVADINDNTPQFILPYFEGSVFENLPPPVPVVNVSATDEDTGTNAVVNYSIALTRYGDGSCLSEPGVNILDCLNSLNETSVAGVSDTLFAINSQTGEVLTLSPLDRENVSVYVLEVVARDSGQLRRLTNSTFVIINVLDRNDQVPNFSQDVYSANISEYSGSGQPVVSVLAEDLDVSSNADVSYSLAGSGEFTINRISGEVFTMSANFDRETQDVYNLTVMAVDGGTPSLTSSALIMVTISDENDSPPTFSAPLYAVSIRENLPPGTPVIRLNATDADIGLNSKLTYHVLTSSPSLHFSLELSTGVLSTSQPLDREQISLYLVTILARDAGFPSLNSTVQVEVTVTDDNDFPPAFINTPYEAALEENTVPMQPIVRVITQDPDLGNNSNTFYSIADVSPAAVNAFEIDQNTGEMFVRAPLDADFSVAYNVTVHADNGPAMPFQLSETVVGVTALDVNDNSPMFAQVDYNMPYLESNPPGSVVINITAFDLDATNQNSALSYEITGGYNTSLFNITTVDGVGVVTVAGILDRETEPRHVLEVTAFDSGSPQLSATTLLTVVLQNVNDNTPVFQQSTYTFTLVENSPVSTLIGRIRATDIDQQNVSYFLNRTDLFRIDPVSGEIFTAAEFDREEQVVHSIIAVATDRGLLIERSAEVIVNVTVLDVNDITPSFTNSTYYIYLPENTSLSSTVLTVEAMDGDFGKNGSFSYSIFPGNYSSFFSINASTGDIFLELELDRETQDVLTFVVVAADFGDVSLTGSAEVVVMVLDNNDNIPLFNASNYTAALPEDTQPGAMAIAVGATDLDINENADISFSLSDDFDGTFSIGEKSGVISLTRSLDYELSQSYEFRVIARDGGVEVLSSSSTVFIEVVDLNDNPPLFEFDVYRISIVENIVLGSPVFQIPATDIDSTSNGELRYSILSGNQRSVFSVDEVFGQVLVADYLDREITPSYDLELRVVDLGIPQFTATATLEVTVLDVNDHIPIFDSKTYSVLVPESTIIRTSVFRFTALDLDVGTNADLSYSIIAGNVNKTFEIGSNSGDLTVSNWLDRETYPSYALSIQVSDNGAPYPLNDTTTIRIIVSDANEYAPFSSQSTYYLNISQDTVVGSPIGHFIAMDRDASSPGTLSYRLLDGIIYFEVDPTQGTVYANRVLIPGEFTLSLEVTDGFFITSIDICITVVPTMVASTVPLFDSSTYLFEVPESVGIGYVVGVVMPRGATVFTDSTQELFMVESSGDVVVSGNLDYETAPVHVINIVIPSNGAGDPPVYAVMTIRIQDANDNPPVFESEEYRVTIAESALPLSTLTVLRGFDADEVSTNNSEFQISLSQLGNEQGVFNLDPSSGVLSLSAMLDYELNSSHVLTAVITNDRATPTLSSTAQIVVSLIDENDNSPQFSEMFYQISIPESTPIGTSVLALVASDADSGTNSELVFSITHLSEPLTFTINQTSGIIITNTAFHLDVATSHVISASVADRGNPQPRAASTTVFVEVTPDNISPPVFSRPDGYSVDIPETLNIGGPVVQVTALDGTEMDGITYSIVSGGSDGIFVIDPSIGLVTLSSTLDFDTQQFHQIIIAAVDAGTPPRTSSVRVNITVLDVNNHAPQFELSSYQVSILENVTLGTSIIQVVATDSDATNITYQITVNYYSPEGLPSFSINSATGQIVTTASIDREIDDVIELLVSAIDFGYPIRRSTTIPVILDVLDLNDSPPVFSQSEYSPPLLRFLSAGKSVVEIVASDPDTVGEGLVYTIVSDDSGGLFSIDVMSGLIETAGRVPEATNGYQLNVTAFDGVFVSSIQVNLVPVDNGDFCEDGGFCTSVRQVNCTFDIFPFVDCNPFCILPFALSLGRRVCLEYSCIDSTLVPCVATEMCQPANVACDNTCPVGMSACPTTNLCHVTTLSEPCDGSNITCLIGQSLVQRNDSTRYCTSTGNLPMTAQSCTSDDVFCEALDTCMNRLVPYLCQPCPGQLFLCPNTNECVVDLTQCCQPNEEFCATLNSCLQVGVRCELPNIAPRITSDLIFLDSLRSYDENDVYSSIGYVISVFLGNPAVDSQGEALSVAIVEASDVPTTEGEWQFALNTSTTWQGIDAGQLSETNALLLPSTARLRFVRKLIELDGAVWLKVKLWDGNTDGFLTPSQNLVQSADPSFSSTLPYARNGPFSQDTTLLAILIHPLIVSPSFSPLATRKQFMTIPEDTVFSQNFGNSLADLVLAVNVPNFQVLSEDRIEGFPDNLPFEQLLPAETRGRYYEDIRRVNPTRIERRRAQQSGQSPGVAAMLDPNATNLTGTWQVALNDDPKQFLDLHSVILSAENSDIVLLNVTARLRFLPERNFCGVTSILLAPWDGFWNSSVATQLQNGYIVSTAPVPSIESSSLSLYNLRSWERKRALVECVADSPRVLKTAVQISPIPYRIAHRYERLFTLLVAREISSLRKEGGLFSNYLQIVLQHSVNLQRFSPALGARTQVSFSIDGDALNFERVNALITLRMDALALLNFTIVSITQDASYGPGAACSGDISAYYHGDHINSLVSTFASDAENDFLGMAIVRVMPTNRGMWQYHRGNWTVQEDDSLQYNRESNIWINFPSDISEARALLFHGNDRLRFLPRPEYYWENSTTNIPSIAVKIWDNSLGHFSSISSPPTEVSTMTINTNPLVDTQQSLYRPVGLFSSTIVNITAARYGCDGVLNSALVHDQCCVCGGQGGSCEGCDGVRGSNVKPDSCDMCGGVSSCLGCDWIPFSVTELRQCQVCLSQISVPTSELILGLDTQFSTSSFTDCNGDCHGNALLDDCEVCSGGRTSHDFNSDIDCAEMCFGNAVLDSCGDCTGSGTDFPVFNQNMDCTGVCNGHFLTDSCGVCQLPDQENVVRENRDCSGECFGAAMLDGCGVCYGESTGVLMDLARDACGVCHGNDTTCVGCDGGVASGRSIDRCGQCGGNNCGCSVLDSLSPNRGPISGGTSIAVEGAGFFLNDTATLGFGFDPDISNCGAPTRFPNGSAVRIVCRFSSANEELRVPGMPGMPVSQGTVICLSRRAVSSGVFSVEISINGGPFSNPIEYMYDDYSLINLNTISPVEWGLNSEITITFLGEGFLNSSSSSACLVYNIHMCYDPTLSPTSPGYISIPSTFVSSSEVRCVLPQATVPCRVTVRLSFDGQESGRVESESTNFIFTYRSTAPGVVDVYFSNDLSSLFIQFDRPAETTGPSLNPSCVDVFDEATFNLIGGSLAMCSWTNSRQDSVTITLPTNAEVKTGSSFTFKNGAIQTRRTPYSFSITDLTVTVNPNSTHPVAVISGPSSIPFCGSVSFSGVYSQYPGYAGFEYYWSILVQDSTIEGFSEISRYLDSLDANSSIISLNSDLFSDSVEYYVQLYVVNSIGLQSETESVRLLKDSEASLHVVVLGSPERSIRFGEQLVVSTSLLVPECIPRGSLNFSWEMVRIIDERRNITVVEDITDIKAGLFQVTLPAAFFLESSRYNLYLTVTSSVNPAAMARANVSISVLPLATRVRIHGGNRTVAAVSELVLDARNSTHSSKLAEPTFTWICTVVGSLDACYNQSITGSSIPIPIMLPNSNFVSFPASTLSLGRSYVFTLRLEQEGLTAVGTVVVNVVNSSPPVVEVTSPTSDSLLSGEVTLSGFVYSSTPLLQAAHWESVQQEGYGFIDLSDPQALKSQTLYDSFDASLISRSSFNPVMATVVPNITNRVNLILSPNLLDPNLSYIFRLTATNSAGSSSAEITVEVNPPPTSATITATPTSGVAMETEFELTVSGALDSVPDSPFLYQFGIITERSVEMNSPVSSLSVQWISGVQASPSFLALFPSGNSQSFRVGVLARVFDRKGGYSDVISDISVLPNPSVSSRFYGDRISQLQSNLAANKDWSSAVSQLVTYLIEINRNRSSLSTDLKEQSLQIFLDIFDTYLSPSSAHYVMASSLFSLITSNQGIVDSGMQRQVSNRLYMIAKWFKNETAIEPSFLSIPTQESGQPLYLQSSYPAPESESLSEQDAAVLLSPWMHILELGVSNSVVAETFVMAAEVLSNTLCQQSSTGEQASSVKTSLADLYAISAPPLGLFNVSGHLVHFGSSLIDIYQQRACQGEGVACSETCIAGISFTSDLSLVGQSSGVRQRLQLSVGTHQMIINEIEGSSPLELELYSDVISVSLSIPSQNLYLTVVNLDTPIQVNIPVTQPLPSNKSVPLCLYREVGGASGFGNYEWLLDNTMAPSIIAVNSVDYYVCVFNHLSEFAVGVLPPPVITAPPPTTNAPTSPTTPITMATTPRTTRESTSPTASHEPSGASPAGPVAAVIVILSVVVVVCVVLLIMFLWWRKKKKMKMKIAPDESTEEEKPVVELLHAGPLTPAESKLPMDIIQCLEEGNRTKLGKMNVLPSIRLRELRFEIAENFPSLKNKPFYFLTRQLCDIEPTTEQQQFVSIVYGNKSIFIREVTADNLQTKKHFCVCGNAAQFECSNCSSQGYCSEECQHSHWVEKHQKECSRLSERKRRSDVLYNRQNSSAPFTLSLSPISETPKRGLMGVSSPTSPTVTTPTDWKSFMGQRRIVPQPGQLPSPRARALSVPAVKVTSLGSLAKRISVPQGQGPTVSPIHAPPIAGQTRPTLGPLKRVSLPGTFTSGSLQTSDQQSRLTPLSPPAHTFTPSGRSSLQSPLQSTPHHAFFTRPQPRVIPPPGGAPVRQLSIQSVGSADFALSPQFSGPSSDIRSEPLLESDEDDYDSTDSGSSSGSEVGGALRKPDESSTSRPPSLAVRKKDVRASSSSSSANEDSTGEERTDKTTVTS